ncbi:CPBP family intramembrane metalloprotease [Micromonospora sp. HM134]|uniref:CPBP family glutamic-type intramembrane protease n=1 Tax=unclassified Micromonospora TaxID=2617518 RepID=UPI0011988AF4|nr:MULTISPECIES: CPBP family glutamic-type intramembrane protease [unclassified Micromonospora]QDY08107.1 CPBP family intramembrane metalloprotease [Micromonospora sp. HM134]
MYAAVLLVLAPLELYLVHRLRGGRDEPDTRWPRPVRLLAPTLAVAALAPGLVPLHHLWQPYAWLTVAVFALPLAVVARRARGLVVAVSTHVLVNLVTFVVLAVGAVQR